MVGLDEGESCSFLLDAGGALVVVGAAGVLEPNKNENTSQPPVIKMTA
jgi:hypothetical protein